MSLAIRGLGTALPANRLPQMELAEAAKQYCAEDDEQRQMLGQPVPAHRDRDPARRLPGRQGPHGDEGRAGRLGVRAPRPRTTAARPPAQRMERYRREALPLAIEACRKALAEAGLAAGEITHLVTVSCTGFAAPGVDVGLIKGLGLRPTTVRTNVGFMGCHGAINGLRVAAGYTGSNPKARVLMCCVELSSLHFYYGWNPKRMVGNALFADGSAAVVGTPADGDGRLDGGGHRVVPVPGLRARHELARRRPRVRHDAVGQGART